ncbi:MAG: FecR family protein [Kofleriaceae bacterium]
MSHVAPHRLASYARGAATAGATPGWAGRRHARIERHLAGCPACARALARLRDARVAMDAIASQPAPELRWDRIRAQTYWALGQTGSRPAVAPPPALAVARGPRAGRARWWVPVGLAAAATAGWLAFGRTPSVTRPPATIAAPEAPPPAGPVAPAAVAPLTAVVTLVEGESTLTTVDDATLVGGSAIGAHRIVAGDRLATGTGRVAVQFDAGSTITVGAASTLVFTRFDVGAIELTLAPAGRVDVEVSKRGPDQRFLVHAGARTVEVRGTAFRVERQAQAVAVACEHGRVAVSSAGAGEVELGAGQALAVPDDGLLDGRRVRPMSAAELDELLAARPAALPQWTDADTVVRTTVTLPLVVPATRTISIDGVAVGTGSLWRRLPPGRHLVEAHDERGRLHGSRWVDLDGVAGEKPVAVGTEAEPALSATGTAAAQRQRLVELTRALGQDQLRGCVRSLAKQGLATGTHVELEVGVLASGTIRYLNIVGTDLPDGVAACVRDVVGRARLGRGAQVSWRHHITF